MLYPRMRARTDACSLTHTRLPSAEPLTCESCDAISCACSHDLDEQQRSRMRQRFCPNDLHSEISDLQGTSLGPTAYGRAAAAAFQPFLAARVHLATNLAIIAAGASAETGFELRVRARERPGTGCSSCVLVRARQPRTHYARGRG